MLPNGLIRPLDDQLATIQKLIDSFLIAGMLPLCLWMYQGFMVWDDHYTIVIICAIVLFYFIASANNLYRSYRVSGIDQEIRPLLLSWAGVLIGLLVLGYSFKTTHQLSRVTLSVWAISTPLVLLAWRGALRGFLERMRAKGHNTRSVIIVGTKDNALALARNIINMPWAGLKLIGFVSEDDSGELTGGAEYGWKVIGDLEQLYEMARSGDVDIVYLSTPIQEGAKLDAMMTELGDTTVSVFIVPDLQTINLLQGTWVSVGDIPTVSVVDGLLQGSDPWIKRAEDIVLSSLALIAFAIPMAVIAVAIKLTSPGPVLFKQVRYGLNGEAINVWKFRTMTVMENGEDFVQVKKGDARITPLGRFLRRTSLDELPQFWNVIKGEMSVVGPRPHAEAHNEEFRKKINGYMLRHKVKPGITGLAQVNGCRGETQSSDSMEKRVKYDMEYIGNWSVWLDLTIVLKTPIILLRGENAF